MKRHVRVVLVVVDLLLLLFVVDVCMYVCKYLYLSVYLSKAIYTCLCIYMYLCVAFL